MGHGVLGKLHIALGGAALGGRVKDIFGGVESQVPRGGWQSHDPGFVGG